MTQSTAPTTGSDLLQAVRRDLEEVERAIRAHPFPDALAERRVPRERLHALAAEQLAIVSSDRRSFAQLAARFPSAPAGDFFLSMAQGEGEALAHLAHFAEWLGLDERALLAYELQAEAQAYPAFVASLALNAPSSAVALAFLANLPAWGQNCGRVAQALREHHGAPEQAVAFFDFFATSPPGFEEAALAVVDAGLGAGESPGTARRAARLLQAYELMFWDAVGAGL
ncbi:MAG: transcriptional regulator [Actinomycetota bacterium]|jgi:thiaminase|nr:transcriptional regulator [Actinomycetota bacterium]MDQ3357150.1 transcriptional regulator [Actinomycetota bacterium]